MANFEKAQKIVGIIEGGYQNDPRDSGNYYMGNLIGTNWGISAPTLAAYLGRTPSKTEMQNLSRQTAEHILKINYWLSNHLEKIQNQSLATLIYDGVVNHGTNTMRFLLVKALRLLGYSLVYYEVFTRKGIQLLNRQNQKKLFYAIKKVRTDKYRQSEKKEMIQGWLNRLDRIHYYPNNSLSSIWPYAAFFFIGMGLILITI